MGIKYSNDINLDRTESFKERKKTVHQDVQSKISAQLKMAEGNSQEIALQNWKTNTQTRFQALFDSAMHELGEILSTGQQIIRIQGTQLSKEESTFDPWQLVVKQKLREDNPFGFSVRVNNALSSMGIHHLGQLIQLKEVDLLYQQNFGRLSLLEVKEILRGHGLGLGCTLDGYLGPTLKKFNEKLRVYEDGGGS